jgi:superfamily II DNA or RNA helicase
MDTSKLRKVRGEFDMREAAAALEQAKIHGDAVEHYLKIVAPGTALVSCVSVDFADAMAARFNAAGIPARAITGGCSEDDQEQIFDDLGKGIIKVVTYCEMLSEGVDVPSINAAILLRPTASVTMYLQQVGRCLRPKADGSAAIILDHVGNVQRHGLPTEERNWTLEGRDKRKRDAAPSVRMCPRCFAANATTAQVCGECGHEFTTEARELEESSGELVEITAKNNKIKCNDNVQVRCKWFGENEQHLKDSWLNDWKVYSIEEDSASGKWVVVSFTCIAPDGTKQKVLPCDIRHDLNAAKREVGGARSMEDLLRLERQRGYKPGWAKHIMAARQTRRVG